ncbi:MAG: PIN domain protein [Planctomycetota bacterium]
MTRVYVDTSVFGGTQDVEFSDESCRFLEEVRKGVFVVLISPLTVGELADAPESVSRTLFDLPPSQIESVPLNTEVIELAEEYVQTGVLGQGSADDAVHVAAATVARADLIISWNFRHIVNYRRIQGFNSVNVRMGYQPITILSPREVINVDEG